MKDKKEESIMKSGSARAVSPFDEVERWFEDVFSRPFSAFGPSWWPSRSSGLTGIEAIPPSVDIYRESGNVVVKAEIPGMKKEDIDVKITDDTITISGEKKKEEKVEKRDYYRYERSEGSFSRSFRLPEGAETDKVKAKFKDGVLEIRVPLSEEAKKKEQKIAIE